jgi:hypothetical protein
MRDFRRVQDTNSERWSAQLHAEYKRVLSQREILVELSEIALGSVASPPPLAHLRFRAFPRRTAPTAVALLGILSNTAHYAER